MLSYPYSNTAAARQPMRAVLARMPLVFWVFLASFGMGLGARAAEDEAEPKCPHTIHLKGKKVHKGRILRQNEDEIYFEVRKETEAGGPIKGKISIPRADVVRIETIVDYYMKRGETELELGNIDEALKRFRQVQNNLSPEVVLDPHERKAKANAVKDKIAACYFAQANKIREDPQGNPADALDIYRKVYEFKRRWPGLESAVASIYMKWAEQAIPNNRSEARPSDFNSALDFLNQLKEWYPNNPRALAEEREIKQDVERIRGHAQSLLANARTLYRKGRYKETISKVDDALGVDPDLEGARHLRFMARNRYQVLPYGDFEFPDTYDPISMTKDVEKRLAQLVFEGLFDLKPPRGSFAAKSAEAQYFNRLAKSHKPSADDLTHTVVLKKNLRWSNGQPLTAQDVKFTVDVMMNPHTVGHNPGWANSIGSVRVDGLHRVSIRFNTQPVMALAQLSFKIIPRYGFRTPWLGRQNEFRMEPTGCGPFMHADKKKKEGEVRLVRNPAFWVADRPRLDDSRLSVDDISDWPGFCAKLNRDRVKERPSPSSRIWRFLNDQARKAASGERKLSEGDKAVVIRALNDCMTQRDLYREEDFSGVAVPKEAKKLLDSARDELSDLEIQTLNRLVIDASYPQEIATSSGLREIILRVYGSSLSARNDLDNGRINMLTELGPEDVNYFQSLGDRVKLIRYQTRAVYFLAVNHRRELFKNKEVRLAILSAFDRHEVVQHIFKGEEGGQAHRVITGPYPSGTWAYDDAIDDKKHAYSPTQAKEIVQRLSQQQGWREITLKFPSRDRDTEKACNYIAAQLRRAGFSVRQEKRLAGPLYDEVYNKHDFDLVYYRFSLDERLDVSPLFDPQRMGRGQSNFSGYFNDELTETFQDLRRTVNPARRKALAHDIHRIVHEELPILPLWQLDGYAVYSSKLRDVSIHPYNLFAFPERWHIVEQEEE